MRRTAQITCMLLHLPVLAQVGLDVPVRLVGGAGERRVDSISPPVLPSSAITLMEATQGATHWAPASMEGDTVFLEPQVPVEQARDGLMLRFSAPQALSGDVFIRTGDGAAVPLLRPDGIGIMLGQVLENTICEVVLHGERFILLAPEPRGCPTGSLQVNDRFCFAQDEILNVDYYQAVDACAKKGGRLCKRDEYLTACLLLEDQLIGLFNGWEWIDETSDHTHTADQAGNATCLSHRDSGPPLIHQTRCCFYLR